MTCEMRIGEAANATPVPGTGVAFAFGKVTPQTGA